jgi:hypothetical protein
MTISAPVDADFLLRLARAGARFASTREVTAHKFAAGHRYLSYLDPSSSEQFDMLAAIRAGIVDRKRCSDYVERAKSAGTFMVAGYPDFAALQPGELYRQNRSNKGIDRPVTIPLTEEVYVPQSMEPRALDWYPPEHSPGAAPFRWSGPSLHPKLLVSFTGDVDARITLHLSGFDPGSLIDEIRLRFNGAEVAHRVHRDRPAGVYLELTGQLLSTRPSVLTLILPRAFCPAKLSSGASDLRQLGVIVTGFTIAPVVSHR